MTQPTCYNPKCFECMEQEHLFAKERTFFVLDIKTSDMPTKCLDSASKTIQKLFDFFVFVHKIFYKRRSSTELYLIQQEHLLNGSKMVRAKASPGYFVVFSFIKEDFEKYFPIAAKATLAVANGVLKTSEVFGTDVDWEKLEEKTQDFDSFMGDTTSKNRRATAAPKSAGFPSVKTTEELDFLIEQYYLFDKDQVIAEEEGDEDTDETWIKRSFMFSPYYLFRISSRMSMRYEILVVLAKSLIKKKGHTILSHKALTKDFSGIEVAANLLLKHEIFHEAFQRHFDLYKWEDSITGITEGMGNTFFDLSNYISWKLAPIHVQNGFFYSNNFYELIHDTRLEESYKNYTRRHIHEEEEEEEEEVGEPPSKRSCLARATQVGLLLSRPTREKREDEQRFSLLYPSLNVISKMFEGLADCKQIGQVAKMFLDDWSFMLNVYKIYMANDDIPCGTARRNQYQNNYLLRKTFEYDHLNAKHFTCIRKTQGNIEAYQDVFVQQMLAAANVTSIKQLMVEFVMMLLGNILGFTTKTPKPAIVLNGPPGAGKSHTAHACRMIAVGSRETANPMAFIEQHYATARSFTASSENKYDSVSGSRLIEEWQSGEGKENNFAKNTSLEATTMKNVLDHGMCISDRGKVKENGGEICSTRDFALNDRSYIILANGFSVCSSLEDRCLVYEIPGLLSTNSCRDSDTTQVERKLYSMNIPQLFAFYRFRISEAMNRRRIGLQVKELEAHDDLDDYEADLTRQRMRSVLEDMGYDTSTMMSKRKWIQIRNFAEVLSHWRAVSEIHGFTCPSTNKSETHVNLKKEISRKSKAMRSLSDEQKTLLVEKRTILDPADLLSAATMVLKFTDDHSRVVRALCCHLLDPTCIEFPEYSWNTDKNDCYLLLRGVSLKWMSAELKSKGTPILEETLEDCLSDLEDRRTTTTRSGGCTVFRRFDGNSCRWDRQKRRFDLLLNAQYASSVFCQFEKACIDKCLAFVVDELLGGNAQIKWHTTWPRTTIAGKLAAKDGSIEVTVPHQELIKAFHYLCLLKMEGGPQHLGSSKFIWPADFANTRRKIAQILLRRSLKEGSIIQQQQQQQQQQTDEEGYFHIPLSEELKLLFKYREMPQGKGKEEEEEEDDEENMIPLHVHTDDDDDQVHLVHHCIFTPRFSHCQDLKNEIVCNGKLLADKDGYILVVQQPDLAWPQETIPRRTTTTSMPWIVSSPDAIKLHCSILTEIPGVLLLLGGLKPRNNNNNNNCAAAAGGGGGGGGGQSSPAETFVRKALCQNMTDMSSVLVFNRDRCYETQRPEDAFSFVEVQRQDMLPEFWESLEEKWDKQNDLELNKWKNHNTKLSTYAPGHMNIKLAYKHLLLEGKISQLREEEQEKKQTNTGSTGEDFKRRLKKMVMSEARQMKPYVALEAENLLPYPTSVMSY